MVMKCQAGEESRVFESGTRQEWLSITINIAASYDMIDSHLRSSTDNGSNLLDKFIYIE